MALGISGSNGGIGDYKPIRYSKVYEFISKYSKLSETKEGLIKKLKNGN